jgi:3-oxoacyl-[acyl-carrier protein] reductase
MTRPVALIPGGARGIGRGLGLALAERGYDIAIAYRTSEDAALATVEEIRQRGASAICLPVDVSSPDACELLVREVQNFRDHVDALIHCAGPFHRVDILEESPEGWREMFANNLDSLFYLTRLLAPGMVARGRGRILAFAMANADRVVAQTQVTAHYLAKLGVTGLVRALAKRLAPHGITANAIAPGFIDSGSMDLDELAGITRAIPAGAVGKVGDVTAAALFLLSDEAAYINGACLHVSGGWGI